MKILKQSTYETCLPCCLLMITRKGNRDEINIWKHGWKFNYLIGQLNYVSNKYSRNIRAYVENKYYFNQLQLEKNSSVQLLNKRISINLLDNLLEKGEVIIYLDVFYLQHILHAPHFVLGLRRKGDCIEIADPADGKIKLISVIILEKAIESLRNHLKYSPVLITTYNSKNLFSFTPR